MYEIVDIFFLEVSLGNRKTVEISNTKMTNKAQRAINAIKVSRVYFSECLTRNNRV